MVHAAWNICEKLCMNVLTSDRDESMLYRLLFVLSISIIPFTCDVVTSDMFHSFKLKALKRIKLFVFHKEVFFFFYFTKNINFIGTIAFLYCVCVFFYLFSDRNISLFLMHF